ncbi:uncharacterized protein MJAP1_000075 [Malassezia japonica]|uniref:DUF221-domain-containing protein n=1 Tax=Malassezia japonica TaxID=223818 RepID=A0AAF0F2N1_9BASI|nr:uncharacterized protein MJAP1_000075 [Malassezia japonica]WFD37133.1 hypothetical protein MJAP1_000075 [Malassezia japonica]
MQRSAFLALAAAFVAPALAADGAPQDTSTSTVVSAMVLACIMAGIFSVLFIVLRPRFRNIYQPRSFLSKPASRNVEPLDSSLFGWIKQFIATPDSEVLRRNGLDAYMFISYINMILWIIVPIWIISWIFFLPLYSANLPGRKNGFNMFTFGNIVNSDKQNQNRAAGVLIMNYVFVAWILVNIHWRMKHFIQLRQEFMTSPEHANTEQAKTMLVTGVPNEYLSETKLAQLYGQLPGGVQKVWVNRNMKDLPKKVELRDKLVLKLEGAVTKLTKTAFKLVKKGKVEGVSLDAQPSADLAERIVPENKRPTHRLGKIPCCGEKVDTINYCRTEITRLNQEINTERERAMNDYESYPPQSSAFVLFNQQLSAHLAARTEGCHEPYRMAERWVEAHPKDVIWSNLSMNPYEKKIRTVLFWVVTWATVIFWCIPVALVGVFAQVDYLETKVPFLGWISMIPNIAKGVLKTVLPLAALAVLNMLLPVWLRFLAKQSGIPTKNGVELSLMTRFFIFQIIQNFLFLCIIQGSMSQVTQFVNKIVPSPDIPGFVSTISTAIPPSSTFFLQWVFVAGFGAAPGMFLMIVPLIVYYVKMILLGSTPRTIWHLKNDMGAPSFGTLFPATLLIVVIFLGFMILAPVMNGFAALGMFCLYMAYRYQFLYVYDFKPQNETGGLYFPKAISFTFAGIYLGTLLVAAMYLFNTGSNPTAFIPFGVLTVLLLVIIFAYHYFLMNSYGPLLNSLPLDLSLKNSTEQASNVQALQAQPQQPALPEKDAYYVNNSAPAIPSSHVVQMEDPHQTAIKSKSEHDSKMNAFYHPARTSKQLVLWYPNDNFGIGRSNVAADYNAGYEATTEQAWITEKGKVDEDSEFAPGE